MLVAYDSHRYMKNHFWSSEQTILDFIKIKAICSYFFFFSGGSGQDAITGTHSGVTPRSEF